MVSYAMPSEGSKVKHIQLSIQCLPAWKSVHLAAIFATPPGSSNMTKSYLNEWGILKSQKLLAELAIKLHITNQQQNLEWTAPWMLFLMFIESWIDSLQFCIAKCDFLFVWHFSCEIWHKVMSHDPALLSKTEMLLLYPNVMPWPITNSPAYCERFQNSLTWIFYNLFTFILPLSQLFWNVAAVKIQNLFIFTKYIYVGQWKLWKSFLSTFVN